MNICDEDSKTWEDPTQMPFQTFFILLFSSWVCNAPSIFQVHGIRYSTGGNYFLPYREFRPPERGWLDSYEDVSTLYIPRTNFPSALLKVTVQCLAGWSMVKELSFHGSFSLGLLFRDSQQEHWFWSLSSDADQVILGFGLRLVHFTGLLRGFKVVTQRRQLPNVPNSKPAKCTLIWTYSSNAFGKEKHLLRKVFLKLFVIQLWLQGNASSPQVSNPLVKMFRSLFKVKEFFKKIVFSFRKLLTFGRNRQFIMNTMVF